MNTKIKENIKAVILGLILTGGISFALADGVWTAPSCSPPNCNVDAPINVGSSAQIKSGKVALGVKSITDVNATESLLQVYGKLLADSGAVFNGPIIIKDGTAQNGYVLTAGGVDGSASWKPAASAVNLSGAGIYYFKSNYYELMQNTAFRNWFMSFPNGDKLVKTPGSAKRLDEGWALDPNGVVPGEPKERQQTTADKLCSYFTGGLAVNFETAAVGSNNNNVGFIWNASAGKWQAIVSNDVNAFDIISVSCLSFGGINPDAASFQVLRPYTSITVCPDNTKYNNDLTKANNVCVPI